MKNFLIYLAVVFTSLFVVLLLKSNQDPSRQQRSILRVFGPSSFISQWGPGPWLKNEFEKTCECRVDFFDGADTTVLMQRLKSESRQGVDVVLGLDQFDLEIARQGFEWLPVFNEGIEFEPEIKPVLQKDFMPYNYSLISFVFRQSELSQFPRSIEDLLAPEWKGKISMEDPRTSSPGLQFLLWLIQSKGEDSAFEFLKSFNKQVKAYSTSWSMAYGLFTQKQASTVLSYVTSPLFHKIEEKNSDVVAIEFAEGHPMQVEYVGVPKLCKQCDLAHQFVQLLLSPAGQKMIMEKNFMFPVVAGVRLGTPFAEVPPYRIQASKIPSFAERERLLKKWAALRRLD